MPKPRTRTLLAVALAAIAASGSLRADTLIDIYETALQNDPVLKAAEASYHAGLEAEVQGRSGLLPQVGAQASYSEDHLDQTSPATSIFGGTIPGKNDSTTRDDRESYFITVSQNLFDLPAWFTFKQGKELSKQAEAQFAADQEDLIVRTVEAYINVLRATDNLKSSRAEEAAFSRQLEQTQQRFEVGLIAITDVHEARAAFDLAVVNRLTDEGNLGVSYEALSVLTGQPHSNLWLLSEDFPVTPPVPEAREEWVDLALKGNFDVMAASYASEAARQASQASKSQHLPTIRGQASVVDNRSDTSTQIHQQGLSTNFPTNPHSQSYLDVNGNTFSITMDVPLYAGGAISSQRRQSYEQYMFASETSSSVQRNTVQFTRSLHLAVVTDVERVKARKQAIVSAQSALDATTAGYEVGTRNVVDVLNAQRILYGAIRDYANTRYDYVVRVLRLRQQAGLLSPDDVQKLNKWLIEPPAATATGTESSPT